MGPSEVSSVLERLTLDLCFGNTVYVKICTTRVRSPAWTIRGPGSSYQDLNLTLGPILLLS
jgi:hypothetical protein